MRDVRCAMWMRGRLGLVALLGVLLWARTGAAQANDPRPRKALSSCAAGDVAAGVAVLAELYAESRDPGYVFNQGRCYQQNGHLEQAQNRFREYLRLGTQEPPEDLERARGFLKEIDETLARRSADVRAKEQSDSGAAALERRRSTLRTTALVLGAVGVVGLGAGAVMSYKVQSQESSVEKRFAMNSIVTDGEGLRRQLSDGGRYETWQWISYGIGIAAAGGALATFAVAELAWRTPAPTGEKTAVRVMPLASRECIGGRLLVTF
jgi:hypothetical protein